jgi:hypothetical protein
MMYELTPSLLFDIYLLQQHASDQGDERYHTTWVKKERESMQRLRYFEFPSHTRT